MRAQRCKCHCSFPLDDIVLDECLQFHYGYQFVIVRSAFIMLYLTMSISPFDAKVYVD